MAWTFLTHRHQSTPLSCPTYLRPDASFYSSSSSSSSTFHHSSSPEISNKKYRSMSSAALQVNALKWLFGALDCLMLGTLIYTLYIDGLPFRKELLTPWMAATLIDFYIAIVALSTWVTYKVPTWIRAVLWIVLLVCFGSITTCTFILVQLFKFSYPDPLQDPLYFVLVRNDTERKRTFFSVTAARILFTALGLLQLGTLIYTLLTDGSPFRKELMTPWLTATLIDFYINIVAFSVWIIYKEAHLISALLWIVLLICLGSITTCAYIVVQLFQLSPQDPLYLVLLNSRSRLMNPGKPIPVDCRHQCRGDVCIRTN